MRALKHLSGQSYVSEAAQAYARTCRTRTGANRREAALAVAADMLAVLAGSA